MLSITILKSHLKHLVLTILNNLNIFLIYLATLELWRFYKKVMYLTIVTDKRTLLRLSEDAEFKMFTLRPTIVVLMSSRLWVMLRKSPQNNRLVFPLTKWLNSVMNIISQLELLTVKVMKFIVILNLLMRRRLLL